MISLAHPSPVPESAFRTAPPAWLGPVEACGGTGGGTGGGIGDGTGVGTGGGTGRSAAPVAPREASMDLETADTWATAEAASCGCSGGGTCCTAEADEAVLAPFLGGVIGCLGRRRGFHTSGPPCCGCAGDATDCCACDGGAAC